MESAFGIEHGEFSKGRNPLGEIGHGIARFTDKKALYRAAKHKDNTALRTASNIMGNNETATGAVAVGVPTYVGYRALKKK